MGFWRRDLPELSLLLSYVLLETAWAAWRAPGLSAGLGLPLVGLLVFLAAAWTILRLARWPALPTWTLPVFAGAVMVGKTYVVSGLRFPFLLVAGALGLPFLLVYGVRRWIQGNLGPRSAWGTILGLCVLASTDVTKVIWLRTGGVGGFRPELALLLLLSVSLGLWLFIQFWESIRPLLVGRLRSPAILALLLLGVVIGQGLMVTLPSQKDPGSSPRGTFRLLSSPEKSLDSRPNIVVISIDTLRWDLVPPRAEGHELPHLAALRDDSVRFDHAFSHTTWTLPAHVSLFSGLPGVAHGVQTRRNRIGPALPWFPEGFSELGYRTAAFTDGNLVDRKYGFDRGFDLYWQHGEEIPLLRHRRFVPGMLEAAVLLHNRVRPGPDVEWRHRFPKRAGEPRQLFLEPNLRLARRWLNHQRTVSSSPFLLFLHTYEIHDHWWNNDPRFEQKLRRLTREHPDLARSITGDTPLPDTAPLSDSQWLRFTTEPPADLPESQRTMFRRTMKKITPEVQSTFKHHLSLLSPAERRTFQRVFAGRDPDRVQRFLERPLTRQKRTVRTEILRVAYPEIPWLERRRRAQKRLYGYGVESVDESLGDFLGWMKRRGIYRDSLIVFLSDHGEGFKLISKVKGHRGGRLSEVLTRVPLWIKLSGNRSAGRTVSDPVQLSDVFPVLVEHLGGDVVCVEDVPCPDWPTGRAGPLSIPERNHVRTSNAWEIPANKSLADTDKRVKLAVRGDTYKQVHLGHYDTDTFYRVFEKHLRQNPVRPEAIPGRQRQRLRGWMEDHRALNDRTPSPFLRQRRLDEELRRDLKGLGYL